MTGVLTLRPPDQPNAGRPLLSVRGLRKSFVQHLLGGTRLTVLDSIDLDLVRGGCMVLGGHSGSGKSTLLRCIHRSCIPDAGSILLDAARGPIDLATADDRMVLAARRDLVGMCTQFLTVVPRVGAADLVATEAGSRGAAMELLASLGLSAERQEAPPATFSGGERQMVALALALARPRPLLLLDEATASLDPVRRRRALDAILAAKRGGSTILAVFHDIPTAPGLVDEVLRLRDGRVER